MQRQRRRLVPKAFLDRQAPRRPRVRFGNPAREGPFSTSWWRPGGGDGPDASVLGAGCTTPFARAQANATERAWADATLGDRAPARMSAMGFFPCLEEAQVRRCRGNERRWGLQPVAADGGLYWLLLRGFIGRDLVVTSAMQVALGALGRFSLGHVEPSRSRPAASVPAARAACGGRASAAGRARVPAGG